MAGGALSRVLAAVAALALVTGLAVVQSSPSAAQLFNFGNGRSRGWDWFERQPDQQQPPPAIPQDFWHAPPPRKAADPRTDSSTPARTDPSRTDPSRTDPSKLDAAKSDPAVTTPILVLGDAMADWLGYGLEQAYADAPEIGILRRFKTWSGLIRTDTKNDPRGEYPDWPQAAREYIATQKPKFVLFMIGTNDRRQLREVTQPPRPKPAGAGQATPGTASPGTATPAPGTATAAPGTTAPRQGEAAAGDEEAPPADDNSKPAADGKPAAPVAPAVPAAPAPAPVVTNLQFHTDAWAEAYGRRIDETIAALKTSGVPVFWVGLPPVRGQKTGGDIAWLNELYRSRADKAGIIFIDVSDGFVDEEGRYVQYGPDVDGQTRRLRSGDGMFFTQAGAKLLAHYVQREIQRWLNNTPAPVAVAVPEEPKEQPAPPPAKSGPQARPLSGPAVALTAERGIEGNDLLGGSARPAPGDVIATKVLIEGASLPAPAGRADDFAWPRRDVAPVDADPVVARTELPMTPMVETLAHTEVATAASPSPDAASLQPSAKPVRRRSFADLPAQQGVYRPDSRRPQTTAQQQQPWSFNSLFSGQSWFRR